MNYNKWLKNNIDTLNYNYKKRFKFVYKTSFNEFCNYIYQGIKIGAYLPKEYTKNLKQ